MSDAEGKDQPTSQQRVPYFFSQYPIVGILSLWFVIHFIWISSLDLSDLPGAGGTVYMLKTIQQSFSGNAFAVWLSYFPNIPLDIKSSYYSQVGSFLGFIGLLLCGWSLRGRKGLIGCGLLGGIWTVIHEYAIYIGPDSWSFGLCWLSVGLCWFAMQQGFLSATILFIGSAYAMKTAASIKFLSLPAICFLPMAILTVDKWKKHHLFYVSALLLVIYSCFPDMNGSTTLQGGLRIPEVDWLPISMGWFKLKMLYALGQPQGKFDQFLIGAVISSIFISFTDKKYRILLLTIASSLVLCVSAFILEDRLRIRLLTPASLGVMTVVGCGIGEIITSKRLWIGGWIIALFLCVDNFAFLHHFSKYRSQWAGYTDTTIPVPDMWQNQYRENNTFFRGTSMYGSISARRTIQSQFASYEPNTSVLYTMRLRDERESNLLVYSRLEKQQAQTLNIHQCCQSRGGNFSVCAQNLIQHIESTGGLLVVPQKGPWLRIHANEKNWRTQLSKAMKMSQNFFEDDYWMWVSVPPKRNTAKLFCNK